MTPQSPPNVKSIFGHALELDDPHRRAAYLAEACADAPAVRAEVEELLSMHARAGGFLRRPAAVAELTGNYEPLTEGSGSRVGPYKLLQQIGEGGMGTVFMAEQEEPVRRKVAVKIIKPGMDSKQVVARFEAERQALAMMDHTNIAKVLDAGTTDTGRPYFVMELVHGVPIVEYCDANKLTPRERLELFVPVCQAIQHAHQKGIIHRDIKPSNILVTMYDDKPVPKVIDFGVAKAVEQRLTEKTLFTQYGALVGTFEYMSPEQAEMNAFGVDTRSDVYSLGVLLYELLTGTTPLDRKRLREAAFGEIVRLIKEEEAPRPSVRLSTSGTLAKVAAARKMDPAKLSSLVRGELDWIVMRCLEKDRTRRYEGASALAKDVHRYLAGDAVEACPPTLGYRLRKAYRRNRAAVLIGSAFAALVVLAGVTAGVLAVWAIDAERSAARERDAAREAERKESERADGEQKAKVAAMEARDTARRTQYVAEINLARDAWDGNRVAHARALLKDQPADLRHFEWHYLNRLMNPSVKRWSFPPYTDSNQISWHPDGGRIVVGNGEVRDFGSGSVLMSFNRMAATWKGEPKDIGDSLFRFTGDGRWLVVDVCPKGLRIGDKFAVGLADPNTGELMESTLLPGSPRFESIMFDAAGKRMAFCELSKLHIWELPSGKSVVPPIEGEFDSVLSPDGKHLARVLEEDEKDEKGNDVKNKKVQLWSLDPFKELVPFNVPATFYRDERLLTFSPDGKKLAYVADRSKLMSGGGDLASSRWQDKWVCVCDTATGKPTWWLGCEGSKVTAMAWASDGARLATGSDDGTVRVWYLNPFVKVPQVFRGQTASIKALAFRPGGQTLASQDSHGVTFWEPGSASALSTISRPARDRIGVRGLADGGRFYVEAHEEPVQKLDVIERETGRIVKSIPRRVLWKKILENERDTRPIGTWVNTAVLSPQGTHLVTVDRDSRLCVHFLDSAKEPVDLLPGVERGDDIVFDQWCKRSPQISPCGRYLMAYDRPSDPASAGRPGKSSHLADIVIWNLATLQRVRTIPNQSVTIGVCRFTHDGRLWLGSTSGTPPLKSAFWPLTDPSGPPEPCADFPPAYAMAFHPESGKAVLNPSWRGPCAVIDVATGRELFKIPDGLAFAFSPDGRRLATFASRNADAKTGIRVWDTTTGREVFQSFPLDTGYSKEYARTLTFSDDGRSVLLHSWHKVHVWDGSAEPKK